MKRYSTSIFITKDRLSVNALQSLLQDCQAEFFEIEKSSTTFQKKPGKFKAFANNVKRVLDERDIEQHPATLEGLGRRIDTALSVVGRYGNSPLYSRQILSYSHETRHHQHRES